jgi:hypothetical protein
MKKARDIRLMVIGLVTGMVLGYFIAVEQPPPPTAGTVTMAAWLTPRVTNVAAPTEVPVDWFESPLGIRRVRLPQPLVMPEAPTTENWRQPLIDRSQAPDFREHKPMRFIPSPGIHNSPRGQWQNFFPGGPASSGYDLIDFNYRPDFKLQAN